LTAAVLSEIDTAWGVLLIAASVLTLLAGVGVVLALPSIWRTWRDARTIEAAESFKAVSLTPIVKRYVPAEHQTHVAREEIAFAKRAIVARRARLKRIAVVCGMVFVCGATATAFTIHRRLEITATASLTTQRPANPPSVPASAGPLGFVVDRPD